MLRGQRMREQTQSFGLRLSRELAQLAVFFVTVRPYLGKLERLKRIPKAAG
jgi:hypothetical protein